VERASVLQSTNNCNDGCKEKDKSAKWKKRGIAKLINKAADRKIKALNSKTEDGEEDEEEVPMKDAHALRQPAKKKKSGN
jgi:hypothetical protein